MAGSAAIFDLDRTLLRSSSTAAINQALHDAGVTGRPAVPGQGLLLEIYDVFGETIPSMALARVAALAAKGWPAADVRRSAQLAADSLAELILPYVPTVLARQRQMGRKLVLATTTPRDLVAPLAARLGFDAVIATRYAVKAGEDGVERYTGGLDGGFVWARGKLQAVREWADREGVDLGQSAAYSDSIYDLPLLSAVGEPTAVNPDYRLHAVAVLRRWPILHLDSPPGVPKILGAEMVDVGRVLSAQFGIPLARFDIAGAERIPRRGGAIVAANHRSYFDVAAYALAVFQAGRNPRFLAKKEMFDAPLIGSLVRASGAICVDRKRSGRAAYEAAGEALCNGEIVVIAPQGTIPRGEDFFDPRLKGRSGVARLADATGAPVIPMGLWGTEKVWPRSSRLPDPTSFIRRPEVRIRVGNPVTGLTGTDFDADTERIMDAITELLPAEAKLRRIPSSAELARATPPGYRSPGHEGSL